MRAAAYTGAGTIETIKRTPVPPGPGEVQIAVAYVGLCGTDLHVLHGDMDARVTTPAVLGHEMSGTVAAVGPGTCGASAGDPVTVMPLDWDGTCPACLAGNEHICQHLTFIGIDSPGALQQLWNVPARCVVPLPAGLSLRHGALVEPVAVAVHDVRRADVRYGERVVVIGGGPIGILIATVAREFGASVAVVEIDQGRRGRAAALGFETVDPVAVDQAAWVEEWTGTAGADAVFEVSGAAAAVLGATSLVKVRGRLTVVAIHGQPRPVDLHRVFWRELTLLGARVYERRDFETAAALLGRGAVPADELITAVVPLEETADAFASLATGEALKVLVDVAGEAAA
ncbi:alcohol dehydrogenase catalytic domain-containing protein [Streptomyces sp. DW26H14]|uniref:alcohol dehydrogenase catalytic domain-containing protein n=1 Tax=Streptomyces sp. DW26H14 TaxID=3435395 RepID=UPI00403DDBF6